MIQAIALENSREVLAGLLILLLTYLAFNRYGYGISGYDGPFLGSVSGLWSVWYIWKTPHDIPFRDLHDRYGPVVRLNPNRLLFSQPEAVQEIYGTKGISQKSDMHRVAQSTSRGVPIDTLFSTVNTEWHHSFRKRINNAFSMSSMVAYESYVVSTIEDLVLQLKRLAKDEKTRVIDFSDWSHYFADDAVTSNMTSHQLSKLLMNIAVTYGDAIGHIKAGHDIGGTLKMMKMVLMYTVHVMQEPSLDKLLWKNPVLMFFNKCGLFNSHRNISVPFALKNQEARKKVREQNKEDTNCEILRPALMDRFLEAQEQNPDVIGSRELLALGLSVLGAGSESTACTLSALFWHLLSSPESYRRLQQEIDSASGVSSPDASSTRGILTFAKAQSLPYLSAVVKEGFRMHPAARFFPGRVVPKLGHTICGKRVPAGTVVGISAWSIHRNPMIFGEDVDIFKPERWLEDEEKARRMGGMLLQFGTGAYTCLGKNIAIMEIYKVVPALMANFEMSLANTENIKLSPGGFINIENLKVKLVARA